MLDRPASHAHDMFIRRTWRTFRRAAVRRRGATDSPGPARFPGAENGQHRLDHGPLSAATGTNRN